MPKIINLEQDTPEWHTYRNSKIGSSDAAAIMKVSHWHTPYSIWLNKLTSNNIFEVNEAMRRGKRLEPIARAAFEKEYGMLMPSKVIESEEYPWMCASLDGYSSCRKFILEIKCPGIEDHLIAKSGKIPPKYYPQVQHQIKCAEVEFGYYDSYYYVDGSRHTVKVYRDDPYINQLIDEEKRFYDHMCSFEPPEMMDRDFKLNESEEWKIISQELLDLKETRFWQDQREEALKQRLILLSGSSNMKGAGLKMSKVVRKGGIDYSKIPELNEVNLEAYRKDPIQYFKFDKYCA